MCLVGRSGYRNQAWGEDEVMPISGKGKSAGFQHAVSLIDSLDTLWTVGLKAEFSEAVGWVRANFKQKFDSSAGGKSVSD